MQRKQVPVASDFMTAAVHTVTPETPLAEIVELLDRYEISNVPVVEPSSTGPPTLLVGFVSEGDCLEYLSNEVFFGSPAQPQTARTMMKRHPVCVGPTTDLFTLSSIFVHHRYRHLPVVEGDRLLGIVSRRDILKALDHFYRDVMKDRDMERFPPDLHEIINLRFVAK